MVREINITVFILDVMSGTEIRGTVNQIETIIFSLSKLGQGDWAEWRLSLKCVKVLWKVMFSSAWVTQWAGGLVWSVTSPTVRSYSPLWVEPVCSAHVGSSYCSWVSQCRRKQSWKERKLYITALFTTCKSSASGWTKRRCKQLPILSVKIHLFMGRLHATDKSNPPETCTATYFCQMQLDG